MSTEQLESNPQYGDDGHGAVSEGVPVQAGEANGSQVGAGTGTGRRRRRRRKGKGPGAQAAQPLASGAAAEGNGAGESSSPPPGNLAGTQPSATHFSAPVGAPPQASSSPNNQAHTFQMGQPQGGGKRKNGRKRGGAGGGGAGGGAATAQQQQPGNSSANGQNRPRQGRQNGAWKARSEGPDGNREGARGGFGSEVFQDNNGNGGSRRKGGKFGRRGPTSFVGPMDHSYRVVNGNIADGPPSTMDFRHNNANGNVNGRNDMQEFEPAVLIREDARVRIICFIEDLFVVAKMQETARKLGVKVQFAKAEKETLAAITDGPEADRPSLIVFDLNNGNAKPLTVIPKLKAKLKRSTSIIGFLQHIQGDLKLKATEAGCDSVMPKAAFSQNLPNLLRRHGLAEEEEMVEA